MSWLLILLQKESKIKWRIHTISQIGTPLKSLATAVKKDASGQDSAKKIPISSGGEVPNRQLGTSLFRKRIVPTETVGKYYNRHKPIPKEALAAKQKANLLGRRLAPDFIYWVTVRARAQRQKWRCRYQRRRTQIPALTGLAFVFWHVSDSGPSSTQARVRRYHANFSNLTNLTTNRCLSGDHFRNFDQFHARYRIER